MDAIDKTPASTEEGTPRRHGGVRTALRVLLGVISVTLIILAGAFLWTGLRLHAELREAERAEVLDIRIDVGAPGQHHATLKQIAGFTCRQYIRMTPELRERDDAGTLLRGLELTITLTDATGVERMGGVFPSPFAHADGGGITIVDDSPMPVGDYAVVVDVVSPAPALAGRPVRFVSGYVLCGIERMAPIVSIAVGAAGAVIGAIIGAALCATRRKKTMQRASV